MREEETQLMAESNQPLAMNPKKFALWLFIGTIVMLFGAFSSAFIVASSERASQVIQLPGILLASTIVIVVSSATMHMAYLSAKKDEFSRLRIALFATLLLGVGFLILQYIAWEYLIAQDVYFVSNFIGGSFIYIFTGVHALHIVSAIIFLVVVVVSAFRLKVHSKNLDKIEMCTTYWHFLGALWLYLYVFLLLNF